jgi:hypothetical protein
MQLAPIVGADIRPHVARFMEGSYDEFINAETAQRSRQKRENHALSALATLPIRDQVWTDFNALKQQFMTAITMATKTGADPMVEALSRGIHPPLVLDLLRTAGVNVPTVEDYDDHAAHLRMLDDWRLSDGFDAVHPMVRQAAREHADAHKKALTGQLTSMGAQQPPADAGGRGSAPAPKGQPSPPKQPGSAPGSSAAMPPTGAN